MGWPATGPKTWTAATLSVADLNAYVRDTDREIWRRLVKVTAVANDTDTTATEASPNFVLDSGSITYTAHEIWIVAYMPLCLGVGLNLYDTSTDLGRIIHNAATFGEYGLQISQFLTPTAAAHQYRLGTWQTGGATNGINAGAGGAGTLRNAELSIWQRGA